MNIKEIILETIDDLNDMVSEPDSSYSPFEFRTFGWNNSVVLFMGVVIWDDDNDYIIDEDEFVDTLKTRSFGILNQLNEKMENLKDD